ncbi:hypothetical protein AVEN_167766-1 [Araneus ventricosus]|uniref:Uncharacterized protein n=1 Tax=Araneus ventricosus TaxID=182803 RepID=A0A4Y2J7V3_ARAVE|nr:hypothetical protein AVEN_167766-1 [Araneus ventricosus]
MSSIPQSFNQDELNDLTRDLNLSKEASESLASRLNDNNSLEQGTKITFYLTKEKDLLPFFSQEENLVFCLIEGLLEKWIFPNIFQMIGAYLLTAQSEV